MNYVERRQEVVSDDGFLQRVFETVYIGLRKCPKCGASAHTKRLDIEDIPVNERWDYIDAGNDFWIVECSECHHKTKPHNSIEGAVITWNDKR